MSELANELRLLRGKESQAHVAHATGLSLRTVHRIENGDIPAITTLRTLAAHYGLGGRQYARLLVAYLHDHLGRDSALLEIKPRTGTQPKDAVHQFIQKFRTIPAKHQRELIRAASKVQVLASLRSLNDLHDDLVTKVATRPPQPPPRKKR